MLAQMTSSSPSIAFGFMVSAESPELVDYCLSCLRVSYPRAPIVVILDGRPLDLPLAEAVMRHRAFAVPGIRLKKGISNGAAIWTRFFDYLLQFDTDFIVKLDPDTRVHRPIVYVPTGNGCAGHLMSKGYAAQHVQGGFQVMTRLFARSALGESRNEIYRNPESWKCGQSNVFTERDLVSTDYLLRVITHAIDGEMLDSPELDCRSVRGERPFDPEAAVTHPHKTVP